ncbi:MAG: CoA transferase, partial [Dehalococcoidia bacterium]|nr:CoA transferase [Dehalococcoidia bacterium]
MTQYPLEGCRVLDFGWVVAGPSAGRHLADMGAEVIKVETRQRIDSSRQSPDNTSRDIEKDPMFHAINRGKLSITTDMGHPKGPALLRRLAAGCDMVLENFAPRVMKRFGLDYESLRQVNPNIIMISLPAAGQYGPLRDIITYGPAITSISGLDGLVGYEGERVLGTQIGYADPTAAVFAVYALLAAFYYRKRTGEGQYIDLAQWEATTTLVGEAIMDYTMNGRVMGTQGNFHPTMAPHDMFPCKGKDKWVSIAVSTEEEWESLCRVMGNPQWTRATRFSDKYLRQKGSQELRELIGEWTRQYTNFEVTKMLQQAGVDAAPCLDVGERFLDPHFQEREIWITMEHPATGVDWLVGQPWKLSKTSGGVRKAAPLL